MYRLDKTFFKAQTAEEASSHAEYYREISWKERLEIVKCLNSIAYRIANKNEPRMDKLVFKARSRNIDDINNQYCGHFLLKHNINLLKK